MRTHTCLIVLSCRLLTAMRYMYTLYERDTIKNKIRERKRTIAFQALILRGLVAQDSYFQP